MDKNQITGLVLISLLLFIYIYFFAPKTRQTQPVQSNVQDTTLVHHQDTTVKSEEKASPVKAVMKTENVDTAKTGAYGELLTGESRDIRIENQDAVFTFSSHGGNIKEVQLKKYKTYTQEPLYLLDDKNSKISEIISTKDGNYDIDNFYYNTDSQNRVLSKNDTATLSFIARISKGKYIKRTYRIPGRGYRFSQDTKFNGIDNDLVKNEIQLSWEDHIMNTEKDLRTSQIKTTITYHTPEGGFEQLKETSLSQVDKTENGPVNWVAFKQKFFCDAIIGNRPFEGGYFLTDTTGEPNVVKHAIFSTSQNITDYQAGFTYFFGPNDYQILKKVAPDFSKNVYLGWPPVIYVNKYLIIPIFDWLERFIGNYGIIIMLLVIIVKILLFPLSYNSYVSMAKTKVLKPQLDAIKQQFGGDMQKVQSEQMKLYQQVGINPLSGCIPVVLQMPILFSMFYFFPNSIELRQQHFLWTDDLSTYDSILHLPFSLPAYGDHVSLFTILMTASTILYTWSTSQLSSVTGPMKTMQYLMPLIFMFVLNSFPAALTFYYFVSNLVTFGQQTLIRNFVDDEKIKRILEENKKKNATKKKSRFQERLEDAMKATEESKKKQKK